MKNVPQMIRKMWQSLLRRAHPSANGSIAERCRSHLCELYSRQQSHGSDLVLNNLMSNLNHHQRHQFAMQRMMQR